MGKNNHEELLGGAPEATSNKQTVEDNLLGRPHVAEKSFAPEAKKDALAPKTPEERFAELQRLTSVYLSEDDEPCWRRPSDSQARRTTASAAKAASRSSALPWRWPSILADCAWMWNAVRSAAARHRGGHQRDARPGGAEFNPQVAQLVEGVTKDHAHRGGKPHRRAGRHHPQDVRSHEQGHPRHRHQAGRPPAQHAHAGRAA